MLTQIQVWLGEEILENYTAPDGSWIQCNTVGAQHLPALMEAVQYETARGQNQYTVRFIPIDPPRIPEKLKKLLNGSDKQWGANGYEWMGAHRKQAGGTTLNRARELHAKWSYLQKNIEFPLREDPSILNFLNQDYSKVWKD